MIKAAAKFLEQLQTIPDGEVPIIVPVFNLVSYAKFMVDQLDSYGLENYIICDNDSTYPPMVEYLKELSKTRRVASLGSNIGPRAYAETPEFLAILPEYFIVTDPDLVFNDGLPKNFINKMKRIIDTYGVSKAGFAIDIDDTKEKFFDAAQVRRWEGTYWNNQIQTYEERDPVYAAPIDTTFCLHKKSKVISELSRSLRGITSTSSVRIAGRFTCEHMGWWKDQPLSKEEEDYYNSRQQWASTYNEKLRLGYIDNS